MSREQDAAVAERVMGWKLTAETPEEIGRAVLGGMSCSNGNGTACFRWNPKPDEPLILCRDPEWRGDVNYGYGYALWQSRYGQAWQSGVQAHVKAWRKDCPAYSTEPAADYAVLVRVRETGGFAWRSAMDAELARTWDARGLMHIAYEVGDYSRAALSTLPPTA